MQLLLLLKQLFDICSMFKKIGKITKRFLWSCDLFSSAQLLRCKNETNYSTLTGGCLSLIILIISGTFLIYESTSVLTMSQVIAKDSTYFLDSPTYTQFKFGSSSNLMLGVGIQGLDLNKPERYFDIALVTLYMKNGKVTDRIYQTLAPCKEEQWAQINSEKANVYTKARLYQFLCPVQGTTVEVEGKFTSDSFKMLEVRVSKCNNLTDPSRPCANESTFNTTNRVFSLNYYFINAYMNSGNIDPVGYYLQDRNYFGFTVDKTTVSNIYLTQNIVETDSSLLPWGQKENKTVLLIKQLAQVKERVQVNNQYISVYLRKSPYFILSERSFQKVQDLLSTVGGLLGFALGFFFFMQFYTEASFEVQIGDRLFYYNSEQPLRSAGFNFFFYLAYIGYELLRDVLGVELPWARMQNYYECRQETKEQLDISHLINKITFLEKCMNIVFEEHQFRAIFLQQKPTVKQAQILRKNHGLNKIIHRNSKKFNTKIQRKLQFQKQKLIKKIKEENGQKDKNCLISIEKISRQQAKQQQKHEIQLNQIIANFVLSGFIKREGNQQQNSEIQNVDESGLKERQDQRQAHNQASQSIQLEQITREDRNMFGFVNTALQDINRIEEEAKEGNVFSQRIYNQLNNDITKEQLLILKCLETILLSKPHQASKEGKFNLPKKKNHLFEDIVGQAQANDPKTADGLNIGLEENLQSNQI